MKLRYRTVSLIAFVTITLCSLAAAQSASVAGNCIKAHGSLSVVNNGNGTTSGIITQGGKLNGTTQAIFTSLFTLTPDPNTFSFTDDLSITTRKGVLRTHNIGIYDLANGLFSAINRIDPNNSTGNFAGATGVLYVNGSTNDGGATFHGEITGDVCSAD